MFLWSFCDGFFAFPAIGFSIGGSSIPGLVPAEQLFQQLHLLKLWQAFIAQVGCPVVIKRKIMKFNWIVNNAENLWLVLSTYFLFFNGRHPSMLQDVITATGSCDCGNYAHSVHQCLAYFCMHCLSIPVEQLTLWWLRDQFRWHLDGATSKEPSNHAKTRSRSCCRTGIGFQVHHLWRWICEQTRCWLSPPSTGIHWHAVCRPKEHPITISDRTPGCFGWNSSPSQFCPPRSVNVHLISATHTIHFLYQPRQAQASTYIPIISIYTMIRLGTKNTIITNKRNNLNNWQ